jgi:hypothetical protein
LYSKSKLVLVLFNLSEVFKVPAGPTDGPIVLNAGDSEYVSSTIAIPSSRGMVEGLRGLLSIFLRRITFFINF